MNSLLFVTGNKNKVKEAQAILGFPIEIFSADLDEAQDLSCEVVARKKALSAFDLVHRPLIVEDVGVYVDAWGGFPGAFVKYIEDGVGYEKLIQWLSGEKNMNVTVRASIGYHDGSDVAVVSAEINGKFGLPRGENGFGFDRYFIPGGHTKSYGEMTLEEKSACSHRKQVLEKFKEYLNQIEK